MCVGDAFDVVDVLRGLGVEGEGAEHQHLRQREQLARLAHRELHLALFQRGVFGAETHGDAFARVGHRAHRVNVTRARQRLEIGQLSFCPPLPRMPVFNNSSRHRPWREVSPERATATSAFDARCASSSASTVGNGTASTGR